MKKVLARLALLGGLAVLTTGCGCTVVDSGKVGVPVTFGEVHEETLRSGFHLKNPVSDVVQFSIRRQVVDLQVTKEGVRTISKDRVSIWVDVAFPYSLTGRYANFVYEEIGTARVYKKELLIPAARASIKNAAAQLNWSEIAVTDKDALIARAREQFITTVNSDLMSEGLSEEDAKQVFTFYPVQLRNVQIPEKLQNAVNERMAAQEDLKRQQTLTSIAEEEAKRRSNVGKGISNMFDELPSGYEPDEMAELLHAIANMKRANTSMMAVERGQVTWGLFTGGSDTSPSVKAKSK